MNKNILPIGICFLFVFITSNISVTSEQLNDIDTTSYQQTELNTRFIGAIRGGILPTVGYSIDNIGNEIAHNITATFTIEGGFDGNIHLFDTLEKAELEPSTSVVKSGVFALQGFGSLTVTLDVDAENSERVHRTAKGFQIGYHTFIFG